MPEEAGQEKGIEASLKNVSIGKLEEIKLEPIAFGLNAVLVLFSTDAVEGIADEIENAIKKIHNVSDVNLERITLL